MKTPETWGEGTPYVKWPEYSSENQKKLLNLQILLPKKYLIS